MLRPGLSGPRFLGRLRPTVTPFPLWTALPPSAYSGVIRLPMDHQPPSLRSGGPPCCQESMRSPKFLTLLSTHTTLASGPWQTLGKLANTLPLCRLLGRESHRHRPYGPYGAVSSFGECGRPGGLRGALGTLHLVRSAFCLLSRCNTRYGWVARPYPVGTSTPQETPSFAWRTPR